MLADILLQLIIWLGLFIVLTVLAVIAGAIIFFIIGSILIWRDNRKKAKKEKADAHLANR